MSLWGGTFLINEGSCAGLNHNRVFYRFGGRLQRETWKDCVVSCLPLIKKLLCDDDVKLTCCWTRALSNSLIAYQHHGPLPHNYLFWSRADNETAIDHPVSLTAFSASREVFLWVYVPEINLINVMRNIISLLNFDENKSFGTKILIGIRSD